MTYHLKVEGTYNIRDLGGYPVAGGATTARHIFIRAGNLDQLPLASQQQLIDYGVKTVIDLRDEWEAEKYPNVFESSASVKYINLPLIGNALSQNKTWKAETQHYEGLHELYGKYLERCQPQIGTIFTSMAESTSTVIFHCYAGKDRTGIIAALLLGVAGVPEQLIAKDYAHSKRKIAHLIKQWRVYAIEHGQDMPRFEEDIASKSSTMLSMLTDIKLRYRNVADYLRVCGVTDNHLAVLRSRFIQPEI